ncbi:SDR family NAD(P)-dependent oxidoreductase [Pseudoruegeria sp. HB172150]|uniref:SDR family NAD(P)-dependent oxidoreductase n=1 Tax=Pseudoruegeria sp. HB172150 TaxID=2721164 RepID=UPI0015562D0D|nr:SDR family oxidoreductase [Pseudoruegeria sp. HB172150]
MPEAHPFRLDGRRALVTGGTSGIGRSVALSLARAGADLVIHHLDEPKSATELMCEAQREGVSVTLVEGDFADDTGPERIAHEALSGGPVDILILNAAVEHRMRWTEIDAAQIDRHVATNFTATIRLAQALIPPMMDRGWGRIVAMGSIMAARPRSETLVYAAMKSAQRTALWAIARDSAARGVTVNSVSPGAIRTARNDGVYADPETFAAITAKIPAGRPGLPEDCIGPILMLCSDAGGYVNGADIPVDGGWSIGDPPGALPQSRSG